VGILLLPVGSAGGVAFTRAGLPLVALHRSQPGYCRRNRYSILGQLWRGGEASGRSAAGSGQMLSEPPKTRPLPNPTIAV
jgi:hypothetical protein